MSAVEPDPRTMFPWTESDRQKIFQEAKILDSPAEPEYDRITRLCSRVFKVNFFSLEILSFFTFIVVELRFPS